MAGMLRPGACTFPEAAVHLRFIVAARQSGPVFLRRFAVKPFSWMSAVLVCALAGGPVMASDRADHDRARAALQAGDILPLATVLQRVAAEYPGQVLAVELERDEGRWMYEIKLLQAGGGLLKLEVDASSARVLKAKARRSEVR